MDIRDPVGPGEELRDVARSDGTIGAHIGADVAVDMAAHPQDGAVASAGDLDVAVDFARMVAASSDAPGGPRSISPDAEMPGGERDQKIFRVELATHAEAAADIALDQVDGGLRQTDLLAPKCRASAERNLRRAVDGQVLLRAVPMGQ